METPAESSTSPRPADSSASAEPEAQGETERFGFGIQSRDAVPMIALISGVLAALSGQRPTGNIAADFVLSVVFAGAVTWLGARAKPELTLASAVAALFFSGLQFPAVVLGLAATLVAVTATALVRFDRDSRAIVLAVSAALTAHAVLRLPDIGFSTSASLLAAIAVAPILFSGFGGLPAPMRRQARLGAIAVGVFAVVAAALAAVTALSVRDRIETGIQQAQDGIDALERGDQTTALALLQSSQVEFDAAGSRLGGPLTWPARLVPIAAQHSRALETAADQGTALASTAARTVTQADVDRIRGNDGRIDVEVIRAVNTELTLANATLRSARESLFIVNTPWLLPQLSSRLESVDEELVAAGQDIDLANHATTVMPAILGANGPRTYLVLFVQPSESREFGGLVGAYGLLSADQGQFDLVESGSINTDFGLGRAAFAEPGDFPEPYVRIGPNLNPQNLTTTPDLATIAAAARELAPQWRQDPDFRIDGVLTLDPYALAGLLELTGPIAIEGRAEPLDSTNVVDFLLREQYLEFGEEGRDTRQDVLRVLAGQAFERLLEIEIPGPEQLGSIFGPVARADRLAMVTFDPDENAFLDRVLLSADVPVVGSAVEMLGIYSQTATASKLDGYASRAITYDVEIDPSTGAVSGDLTIVDSNNAPPGADEYILGLGDTPGPEGGVVATGDNFLSTAVYTRGTVGPWDVSTPFFSGEPGAAYTYTRHPVFYTVPLGGSAEVRTSIDSRVEPERYDLLVPAQALAQPASFELTIRPTEGWRVVGATNAEDGSWTGRSLLSEPRAFTFAFERTDS